MKIQIDEDGYLFIERAGKMKSVRCPVISDGKDRCGDWCALFGEPKLVINTFTTEKVRSLPLCHKTRIINGGISESLLCSKYHQITYRCKNI